MQFRRTRPGRNARNLVAARKLVLDVYQAAGVCAHENGRARCAVVPGCVDRYVLTGERDARHFSPTVPVLKGVNHDPLGIQDRARRDCRLAALVGLYLVLDGLVLDAWAKFRYGAAMLISGVAGFVVLLNPGPTDHA